MKGLIKNIILYNLFILLPLYGQAQCNSCSQTISEDNSSHLTVEGADAVLCITGGTFTGEVTLKGAATLCISSTATFIPESINADNTSTINNHGTWKNTFPLVLSNHISNYGVIETPYGFMLGSDGIFNHEGKSFTANKQVVIDGEMHIAREATIGSLHIRETGLFTLSDAIVDVKGDFTNHGHVNASGASTCAQIKVGGTSFNRAFFGNSSHPLDICDKNAQNNGFDINNGMVGTHITHCQCQPTVGEEEEIQDFQLIQNGGRNTLYWITHDGSNLSHFIVESSETGKTFTPFTTINAKKNEQVLSEYSTLLKSASSLYYRLKIVDKNQSFTYSNTIKVDELSSAPLPLFIISKEMLNIFQTNPSEEIYTMKLQHSNGELVQTFKVGENYEIPLTSLQTGAYVIHFENNKHKGTWRFIKN